MHVMKTDLRTGIIEVEMIGFWSLEDVAAYRRDLSIESKQVAAVGKRHMLLVDYSQAVIQQQVVVAALAALTHEIESPALRIAAFTQGRMAKLQAKRIAAERDDIRIFDSRAEALAWLMEARSEARTVRSVGGGSVSASF